MKQSEMAALEKRVSRLEQICKLDNDMFANVSELASLSVLTSVQLNALLAGLPHLCAACLEGPPEQESAL